MLDILLSYIKDVGHLTVRHLTVRSIKDVGRLIVRHLTVRHLSVRHLIVYCKCYICCNIVLCCRKVGPDIWHQIPARQTL